MTPRFLQTLLVLPWLLVANTASARDKTDMVVIANGDSIHGEIVELAYGQLSLKTDSLGTIHIEWPDVRSITSGYRFFVEQIGGVQYFGSLEPADEAGYLLVRNVGGGTHRLEMTHLTNIDQVEDTFWSRLNGSLSVGFNYTKSTDISVSSVRFDTEYRSRRFIASVGIDADRTTDADSGTTDRLDISYTHQVLRPGPGFWFGGSSLERNEQLGIESRLQLMGGVGRTLRDTSSRSLITYVGVAVNQEWTTGEDDSQQTLEGVLGADWRIFRFRDPETSLTSSLVVYPSLSDGGRYRSTLDVSLRREMIEDLYLDLSVYGAYDNRPPDEGDEVSSSDYGIVTSVGYSF
jgi:hypothetical protein